MMSSTNQLKAVLVFITRFHIVFGLGLMVSIQKLKRCPILSVRPGTNPLREQALTIVTQILKFSYQHEPTAAQRRFKGEKMKATHYTDIQGTEMNNDMVKNVTGRVLIGKDDGAPNFCMRRFDVEPGGHAPRHTHDWEHEIYVVEGKGEVLLGDQWHAISPGTAVYVPPNVDHQIKNSSDGQLAFLCLVPSAAPEM